MIKIILLLLLTLGLYANEVDEWVKNDSQTIQKLFRGTSEWFVADDLSMESIAKENATNNAYSFISEYFGISIKSTFGLNKQLKNNTKTTQLILNLKSFKTYQELDENKKNFREHVIIFLDDESKKKIRDLLLDRQELKELKKKVLTSIDEKKYFKARNFLNLAKTKQSALADNSIGIIEKRLNILIATLLQAKLTLNKKVYQPDESIELEVSLNQDGFLYIFYETGLDVAMIFPNKYQRVSRLNKNESIFFPNESIEKVSAYADDLGQTVNFYAIASKTILPIKSLCEERIDGVYIYEKTGSYKKLLNKCMDKGICTKTVINFKVSNTIN